MTIASLQVQTVSIDRFAEQNFTHVFRRATVGSMQIMWVNRENPQLAIHAGGDEVLVLAEPASEGALSH